MGFMDDMLDNIKSAAGQVGKQAGKLVDVTKLKASASELKAQISVNTTDIGEYVRNNADKFTSNPEIAGKLAEIKDAQAALDAVNGQIAKMQNKVVCNDCSSENSTEASFCHNCGSKLPEQEEPVVPPAPEAPEAPAAPTEEPKAEEENKDQ